MLSIAHVWSRPALIVTGLMAGRVPGSGPGGTGTVVLAYRTKTLPPFFLVTRTDVGAIVAFQVSPVIFSERAVTW